MASRLRLALASFAALLAGCSASGGDGDGGEPDPTTLTGWVDPFIGSGGLGFAYGAAFPGAAVPRGLAKVGPDTSGLYGTINFLHYSGYWYGDDEIRGFSHLHMHGTGLADYGVISVMPTDGFDETRTTDEGYLSPFSKSTEEASPGYYAVTLDRGEIRAEITATAHGAHHRWTFDEDRGWLIFDLAHHLAGGEVPDAELHLDAANGTIRGRVHNVGALSDAFGGADVYFAARFDVPWSLSQTWTAGVAPAPGADAAGAGAGAALSFDSLPGGTLEMQLGLSFVSADAAWENLLAELPAWDFEATRAAADAGWESLLSRVEVIGGERDDRYTFYSALYRNFLLPTIVEDADGGYRGHDGAAYVSTGFTFVSDLSLWDTYRTTHPLYHLVAPDVGLDAVRSLQAMAEQSGAYPRWPMATGDAGTMLGASAEIVIADAHLKGVGDFDIAGAYATLRAAALEPVAPPGGRGGREHVEDYMQWGYVPSSVDRSVSHTTEYALDDFALGNLALSLNLGTDGNLLLARSRSSWRALRDPATGYLRARAEDGSFAAGAGFDPTELGDDYAEANAEQMVWAAFHDVAGQIELEGGESALVARLEAFFESARAEWEAIDPDDTLALGLPRPYFWAGNEPDIHAPWIFALAGRPDLTNEWVRWVMDTFYGRRPDGLPGNDDGGTLSAWYVWGALGLYPIAGSDRYVLGAPRFPEVRIAVPGGTFTIRAEGPLDGRVDAIRLDGTEITGPEITHDALAAGSELTFVFAGAGD